jgi:hypothetical protein
LNVKDIISDIRALREEIKDEQLFGYVCSGGNLLAIIDRWRKEKISTFVEEVSEKFYVEIDKHDKSISKADCRQFVLDVLMIKIGAG